MTSSLPRRGYRRSLFSAPFAFVLGAFLFFAAVGSSRAQSGGTGRVQGRVFNPATNEYVRNAEVRLQGTERIAYSEEGGVYQLDNVPAGTATLQVTFVGYQTASATVNVTAGQTATRDFELVSALAPAAGAAGDSTVKMGAFVVSTEREGNAKAIMEQRRNMNISTSVAADSFGDITEGNVGEFLKFLPGVDVEYVDGISRGPRVGGLDQQYVGVTMDGASVASADAFASYGSTLNGTAGSQARSVGFEQMSITAVESIEINRTLSPDMDAGSPAGSINMKSKRAFDRKGRRIDWQASYAFNTPDAAKFKQVRGPDDNMRYQWQPNFQLDYSDVFLGQRLGVRASLSKGAVRTEQQYVTHTYNRTTVTTGANQDTRPTVLTALAFTDGPRLSKRANATTTFDFKATSRLVLSLTAMFNAFENNAHTKTLTFTAGTNNTTAATGRQNVQGNGLTEIRTNRTATNTAPAITLGGGSAIKLTNSVTVTPKFEYKLDRLTVDGTANFSRSKNDYETTSRGTIRVESLDPLPVDFVATRPDESSAEWTITQTGGADWSNLANFRNPRISEEGRFAYTEIRTGELNARYVVPMQVPVFFKFGGKVADEKRETENTTPYLLWSYIGPGGNTVNPNGTINPVGSFGAFPSPRAFNPDMGRIRALNIDNLPTVPNRSVLSTLFREHPEYFTNVGTAENYYSGYIANKRDFGQKVTAAYGMGNARLGPMQLQGGLRWERTETNILDFDPRTAAEVQAAGYTINTSTRRATTIPGLEYQYLSQPRVTRKGEYDHFFPSVSAKFSPRPNLQLQAGYSHAIARPPIDALAGVWSINELARLITAPNPNLEPEISDNYVARLAYYFEPVGSFTFLVQQIEIRNQRITQRASAADFGYGDDPEYADYDFQTQLNREGLYVYRSMELGFSRQLSFLPSYLRSTNVNFSYTRNYANEYFPGVVPHKFTSSVAWNYRRLSLRVGGVWQDDTPYTTVFGRYQRHNFMLDVSGGVKLTARTSLFFQGRNILNQPTVLYEGDPVRGIPAQLYRYGNFGVSWSVGIRGNF